MDVTEIPRDSRLDRAYAALRAVLPRSVAAHISGLSSDPEVVVNGERLRVEWIADGGLRQVRQLLADERRPDVVVASRLSLAARERLSGAHIGWVDETGAAEIAVGSIVVSRTGRRPVPVRQPARWTPAVLAVSEALLCGTRATVSGTQGATGLSAGSCTHALRLLTDRGFLTAPTRRGHQSARTIVDSTKLLEAYASAADALASSIQLEVGVTWREPLAGLARAGSTWDKIALTWAVTGAAAAAVLAPYLTTIGVTEVYVDVDTMIGLEAAAADARLRPMDGGRLHLRPFPTIGVRRLAEVVDGIRVAPWPRVYVDLRRTGVRGEEAAEHLRETVHAR